MLDLVPRNICFFKREVGAKSGIFPVLLLKIKYSDMHAFIKTEPSGRNVNWMT